jgi:type I restriction enzyme S subunit
MTVSVMANLALLADAPGGISKLRALIHELALRGYLLKQGTDLSQDEEGAPYRVPQGWAWSALGDVTSLLTDGEHLTPARTTDRTQVALATAKNVRDGYVDLNDTDFVERAVAERCWIRCRPQRGDVLMVSVGATLGRLSVLRDDREMVIVRSVALFRPKGVDPDFLALALRSPLGQGQIWSRVKQSAQPCLYLSQAKQLLLPVPPLAEQHRIVAKVDELMALCDRLEARQQGAEAAHARLVQALLDSLTQARDAEEFQAYWQRVAGQFTHLITSDAAVEALKTAVVLLAVSGRLVPQAPEDVDGSILLRRLVAAKQVAAEDARKQKEIAAEDLPAPPFDAPAGWAWTHLGQVLAISGGVTLGRKLTGRPMSTAPYLRVANVQRGRLDLKDVKEIEVPSDEIDKYRLEAGDLLITEGGDWDKVGRTSVWADELPLCLHQNHIFRARRCSDELDLRWVELYLNSPVARDYFAGASKQTTNLASINMTQLRSCTFPVPPLDEQRRIVAKVTELLAICDQLKARIAAARAKHAQLAEALVAQAVAA